MGKGKRETDAQETNEKKKASDHAKKKSCAFDAANLMEWRNGSALLSVVRAFVTSSLTGRSARMHAPHHHPPTWPIEIERNFVPVVEMFGGIGCFEFP